ncbi:MAG TPA: type II toxin-antitoxin system VapC family toxin, partial [Vicinamibacterales bacterium]|nr:type II toxin-antitoxin system VapC family toxin [Vicinamibacterales bacterium]
MRQLVVDASVAIKWFVPEVHSPAAVRLLDPDTVLFAPDSIGPEIANALWKKVRRGEITADEASEILSAFARAGVEIFPSHVLVASAFELAVSLGRTVYDGLYLALAIAQDCPLVTADRKFHAAVSASPFAQHIELFAD